MKDFQGRVAVVTGAASGIGRGMAEAFVEAGMKVVLSDVEERALHAAARALRGAGGDVQAVAADVSKPESVEALAEQAHARYGKVHVLCNNAGIATGGGLIWENQLSDWEWIVGVNLMGVVHGIRAFVPRMIAHGEEGCVVNTASLAGMIVGGGSPSYTATKFGVVGLSETLYQQLQFAGARISASVLCPAWVNTNIGDSDRNRPESVGPPAPIDPQAEVVQEWVLEQLRAGLDPKEVGALVLDAIRNDRFYIFTHPDWMHLVEGRVRAILAGDNPPMLIPPGAESLMQRLATMAPQ